MATHASPSDRLRAALADIQARMDAWRKEREAISAEVQRIRADADDILEDLGTMPGAARGRRRGGRPKGYKASAATKAKLRAAWKRRKARAGKGGTRRRGTISPEGRARIAAAQRKRWAKMRQG